MLLIGGIFTSEAISELSIILKLSLIRIIEFIIILAEQVKLTCLLHIKNEAYIIIFNSYLFVNEFGYLHQSAPYRLVLVAVSLSLSKYHNLSMTSIFLAFWIMTLYKKKLFGG